MKTAKYVMLADCPHGVLKKGDVITCHPYLLDPEKLTVVKRERDGLDPGQNVYRTEVAPYVKPARTPEQKADAKACAYARKNHTTFPCECDPRSPKRCTKSGWVRCNKRLAALRALKAKILAGEAP